MIPLLVGRIFGVCAGLAMGFCAMTAGGGPISAGLMAGAIGLVFLSLSKTQ